MGRVGYGLTPALRPTRKNHLNSDGAESRQYDDNLIAQVGKPKFIYFFFFFR